MYKNVGKMTENAYRLLHAPQLNPQKVSIGLSTERLFDGEYFPFHRQKRFANCFAFPWHDFLVDYKITLLWTDTHKHLFLLYENH